MRIAILVLCLLLLAGCTAANPPATKFLEGEKPTAQPPTSATRPDQLNGLTPHIGPLKKFVFVIDHSASMTETFPLAKKELIHWIRQLRPNQAFWITFFSSGPTLDLPTPAENQVIMATEVNKKQAFDFIDNVVAVGRTDPTEALRKAFDRQPDLIYILTNGEFDPSIATLIKKLNPNKVVTINTICLVYPKGEPLLKKIATENAGSYRLVSEEQILNSKP